MPILVDEDGNPVSAGSSAKPILKPSESGEDTTGSGYGGNMFTIPNLVKTLKDTGVGVKKGLAGLSTGALDTLDRVTGANPYTTEEYTGKPLNEQIKSDLAKTGNVPSNTAEERGAFAGKMLPLLATPAPEGMAANAALNALLGGAMATFEGATPGEAAGSGVAGALIPPVVSKTLGLAGRLVPSPAKAARGIVNNYIRPAVSDFNFGHDPTQAVLDLLKSGARPQSVESLVNEAIPQALASTGQKISGEIAAAPKSPWAAQLNQVLAPLQQLGQDATNAGREGIASEAENVRKALSQYTDAAGKSKKRFTGFTPQQLFDFKKQVGDMARWTPQAPTASDIALNGALQDVYGNARQGLVDAVPSIEKLLPQYGNLAAAGTAGKRALQKEAGARGMEELDKLLPSLLRHVTGVNNPQIGLPLANRLNQAGAVGDAIGGAVSPFVEKFNQPAQNALSRLIATVLGNQTPAPPAEK